MTDLYKTDVPDCDLQHFSLAAHRSHVSSCGNSRRQAHVQVSLETYYSGN